MKIIYKLILGFLVVALMISVVGYFAVKRSKDALEKSIAESSQILATKILDEIDRNIFRRIEETQSYLRDPAFQKTVSESNRKFEKLDNIKTYINEKEKEWVSASKETTTPFISGLLNNELARELREKTEFYKEKYGYQVFNNIIATNKYGAIVAETAKTTDFRQDDKKWWQEAKENRFYIDDEGIDINFAVRIDDQNGNFIGVMKCILSIEDLIQVVKGFETEETLTEKKSIYKLINKMGKIIYSTDDFTFLEDAPYSLLREDEKNKDDKNKKQDAHIFKRKDNKHGEVLYICAHSSFTALGTIFLLEHETKKIFAPVDKLKTEILFISLAVTIFAILMGFLFSRSISEPVTKLRDAAIKIGKGKLDTDIEVKSNDEIGQLSYSFKKMAEDLQKTTVSKDYVDNIIKTISDSLIVLAPDATIRTVNQAALNILGYTDVELLNQPVSVIFTDEEESFKSTWFADLMEKGTVSNIEKTCLSKGGRKIPVLFSGSLMQDQDNEGIVKGIVCLAIDITERKRAEEQLRRYAAELNDANEEIKNFAYIVSHDLRAPLINIKGFSNELNYSLKESKSLLDKSLLQIEEKDRAELKTTFENDVPEALEFINSSVNRMDTLINSILKLSRLGRRELKPQPINMEELVQSILRSLAYQIEQHNVKVTMGALPEITADRTSMEQIVGNILDNALKYLKTGIPGELEITAERRHGETIFRIRDNGRGIAKDDMHKVFEIFRRAGKQDKPGEGMGLACVKAIVRRQGGRIWCDSELDKGTTLTFTVPDKLEFNQA